MHLPRALAAFNRHVTNPIQRRWAGRIPLHAIIEHTGRRSGRAYRTPVMCFAAEGGFVFVVGYGLESDWLRNVLAAGRCVVVHRGRRYDARRVRLLHAPDGPPLLPMPLRVIARIGGPRDVLRVWTA